MANNSSKTPASPTDAISLEHSTETLEPTEIISTEHSEETLASTDTIPAENSEETLETTDTLPTENSKQTFASTVIWRIENLSVWEPDLHGRKISSSEFVLRGICKNAWKLHFNRSDPCKFTVDLSPSRYVEGVTIDAEWSLVRDDGSLLHTRVTRYTLTTAESTHSMYLSTRQVYMSNISETFIQNDSFTVQVRVWKRGETATEEERVQLVTRYLKKPLVKEKFFWCIRNFSALRLNNGVKMTVYMRGDAFRLSFFLRGMKLDEASVGFSISSERAHDQGMQVTIELMSKSTDTPVQVVETKLRFNTSAHSQTWVLPDLMPRQEILARRTEYLENDILLLSCGFLFDIGSCLHSYIEEYYNGPDRVKTLVNSADGKAWQTHFYGTVYSDISDQETVTMLMPFSCPSVPSAALGQLSSQNILLYDIKNLFTKKTFSDFELRSENRSFAVHKNILCARSAVFEEMFCGDMKAASSMDVPDLDCETLGHFLFFLYTGTLERVQWKEAMKLYDAALQYRIRYLEEECRGILINAVNLTNVTDIFEMADRAQDQKLRSYAFDFIQYNFDVVVLSDEWDKFLGRSFLAGETMKEIYRNRKHMRTV